MNHPYSGTASYIYANEYPYTPVNAHHNDPYGKMQSFVPIQSVDSLPISHPYSLGNTVYSTTEYTNTETQFSQDDDPRPRRDSQQRRLLPQSRPAVAHPYAQPSDNSWIDDESVAETPVAQKFPPRAAPPARKRTVTIKADGPAVRRSAFVPYEPRPFEDRERERAMLAAVWRRQIQRRVRRALRRLRRFLEGL